MGEKDLKHYIVSTYLANTGIDYKMSGRFVDYDSSFLTKDLVYLDSGKKVKQMEISLGDLATKRTATDWALANGAYTDWENYFGVKFGCVTYLLRTARSKNSIDAVNNDGSMVSRDMLSMNKDRCYSICPSMRLDAKAIASAKEKSKDNFKIEEFVGAWREVLFHTIQFGEYPKSYVGDKLNKKLENIYLNGFADTLRRTGNQYLGRISDGNALEYFDEYEYGGQRYVRVKVNSYGGDMISEDGSGLEGGTWNWIKVEPIAWEIRNWDDMPKSINPAGSGSAKTIDVRTAEAIACIPFYPNDKDANRSMWQNSTIRGYLNGINVMNITENGNPAYSAPNGGDFR